MAFSSKRKITFLDDIFHPLFGGGTLPYLVPSMHAKLARSPTQVFNLPSQIPKVATNEGFDIYGECLGNSMGYVACATSRLHH